MNNFRLIEALLYIRGKDGITPKDLKDASLEGISTFDARKALKNFMKSFNDENRGFFVVNFNEVFKFATRDDFQENITKLVAIIKKQKLSQAAIETIGIIAYKQPVTKGQINAIRNTSSESVVNTLLIKGLVEEKGISETPGRPILYGITDRFYDYFQIKSLNELPKLSEFNESEGFSEDFELFSSQRQDDGLEFG